MTLVWASGYNGITDPDAQTYLAAVEAADGQALEGDVAFAINDFVVGCKFDGIWDAIKASCILAGARTLNGALVPLKGTAPTNNNFVSGDYNREAGLVGDGSTKYLDSLKSATATSATNYHQSVFLSAKPTLGQQFIASDDLGAQRYLLYYDLASNELRCISGVVPTAYLGGGGTIDPGFKGVIRNNNSTFTVRTNSGNSSVSSGAGSSTALTSFVFAVNRNGSPTAHTNARLSFYSIGESLDLALLDNRVSTLMTDIGAAIP